MTTIKLIEIVKRRDDLTRAEFRKQFESAYAPLVYAAIPELTEYVRNHVLSSQLPAGWQPDFDALTVLRLPDGTSLDRVVGLLDGSAGGDVAVAAAGLIDRSNYRLVRVEEYESELPHDSEPVDKMTILLCRRRDLLTAEEYKDRYENGHAVLACKVIPHFLRYVRNYAVQPFTPGIEVDTLTAGWESGFDTISEMSYGKGAVLNPIERRYMVRDEETFCDRASLRSVLVEQEYSPLG